MISEPKAGDNLLYDTRTRNAKGRSAVVVYRRLRSYGYTVLEWCSPPRPHNGHWWVVYVQRGDATPVYRCIRLSDTGWQIMPAPEDVIERLLNAPTANDNNGESK